MSDLQHPPPSGGSPGLRRTTRRRFLALMATLGVGATAGCSRLSDLEESTRSRLGGLFGDDASLDPSSLGPEARTFRGDQPRELPDPTPAETIQPDVCVVGGGAAGMAAATAAARAGADTLLLEESYVLGGNVTRGLVNLDKVAYGGAPMVAGYFQELIEGLSQRGTAVPPGPDTDFTVPAEADDIRHYALYLARSSGADVRLGASAYHVERDGNRVARVLCSQQGSSLDVRAKVFVDCTGDGHLGYAAGCGYWLGDRTHGQVQGQTLIFYAGPVDFVRLQRHARATDQHLIGGYQVIGFGDVLASLRREHPELAPMQQGMLINRNLSPLTVSISASEVYADPLNARESAVMLAVLQEQNNAIHARMRDLIPGFENSRIVRMADRPYLREGRRLIGLYQLTAQDVIDGVKPDDSIARGWYPMDLHVRYAGGPVHVGHPDYGDWYGIPYRCLVARDAENLLMAGRCISVTHEALGSSRISPTSMALGQAAGIAAALAAGAQGQTQAVDSGGLRQQILDAGGLV